MSKYSAAFRMARKRVFTKVLAPAGFKQGKPLAVRAINGQYHGIEFRFSRWGDKYFVNIAFHFDFIPGLNALADGKAIDSLRFSVLDFMWWMRLEHLMEPGYPSEHSYAQSPADVELGLALNAQNAVKVLDQLSARWRDPAEYMRTLPPDLISSDFQQRLARVSVEADARGVLQTPVNRALGFKAHHDAFNQAYSLAAIAIRCKEYDLAEQYLEIAQHRARARFDDTSLSQLRLMMK